MAPHICGHDFKISSSTFRSTTIRTNYFFHLMFFRPENEISNSIIFVLGDIFYLIFNFIIILFLVYEIFYKRNFL